jgi:hypothetical protein
MGDLQHRRATCDTPPEVTRPAASPEPEPHLAPGGGNSLMLGAIGSDLDNGVRSLAGGGQAYGVDPMQDGLFGGVHMLDRMMAQVELGSRFEIVGDDFIGPRKPNQVSQAEFNRIAILYSDLRMGDTNVKWGTSGMSEDDAAAFKSGTMDDIADILTTTQGRELMDQLAYQEVDGRDLTTTLGRAANPGDAGAYIDARDPERSFDGTGTSGGVNYQPGRSLDMAKDLGNADYESSPWAKMSSDIVLFHELVHANHSRQGLADAEIVDGQYSRPTIADSEAATRRDRGTAVEEYATVGLAGYGDDLNENAYRAERSIVTGTPIPRRDNYNGAGPKKKPKTTR